MTLNIRTSLLAAGVAASAVVSTSTGVLAGGFDRGGVVIDQLFDTDRFSMRSVVQHVMPRRSLKNVKRGENLAVRAVVGAQVQQQLANATPQQQANPAYVQAVTEAVTRQVLTNPALAPAEAEEIKVDADFTNKAVGLKMGLTDKLDCLFTYSEPYGADADYGTNNAYSASATEFSVATKDFGTTCSYKFDMGETSLGASNLRVILGGSFQSIEAYQYRQRFLDLANAGIGFPGAPNGATAGGVSNSLGLGKFSASGDSAGFRVGVAYEIPDIALRAMVLYHSKYDYDLSGTQDNTGFGALIPGTGLVPITASTEIPQALEVRLRSGINERTLGYLNVKWQQWSKLGIIPIQGGRSPIDGQPTALSFDPEYRDGWTISGGVGRKLTDNLSGLVGLGWDRGTATVSGFQSDTYTLSAGLSYKADEHFEISLGGLVGLATDGESKVSAFGDAANNVTYDFDTDPIYAISGAVKLTF